MEPLNWEKTGDIDAHLEGKSRNAKLKLLKDNVNIYYRGWGLDWARTPFSKKDDAHIGTVEHLSERLEEILTKVHKENITKPDEVQDIPTRLRNMPVLGTLTIQASELKPWTKEGLGEIYENAKAAEDAKASKTQHDLHSTKQPRNCPELSSLKGHHIEVLLEMEQPNDDDNGVEYFNWWCCGEILEVSDADTKIKVGRKQKKLAAGIYALVKFDNGETEWMKLESDHFNCNRVSRGWRLDTDDEKNETFFTG